MSESESSAAGPLLVFADDWGRHPSSCQHLIGQLLPRCSVYWVNTIGMRTPRVNRATLRRAAQKLADWLRSSNGAGSLPSNLRVLNPRMWPWFGGRVHRWVNQKLLLQQLQKALATLPAPPIAISTIPIVADLIGKLPVQRWVYYCVDDFGNWPGLDQHTLRRMEQRMVDRADVLIAASEQLRDRLRTMGRSAHLLTHGVDLNAWTVRRETRYTPLAKLERPLVVFWGLIDRRIDAAMVNQLAADMTHGTIVLIGPTAAPAPAIFSSQRIVHVPAVPLHDLPAVASCAAVLVMPYADLPVTRAMQPLKLKEYLASGKPAVVRGLPSTREWRDCLDLVETPQAFSDAVRARIAGGLPEEQRVARLRLDGEGWNQKAEQFEQWVGDGDRSSRHNYVPESGGSESVVEAGFVAPLPHGRGSSSAPIS